MDVIKIADLVQALELVGQVYRNKDGSQPAEAIKKILQQLQGAERMTVAEWVETRRKPAKGAARKPAKAKIEAITPEQMIETLERSRTQAALREAVASSTLKADQWKLVAKRLTGSSANSGKAAREAVETYFSDRLLLNERVESVKRQFA